jgi:hypothetical protein
MDKQLEYIRLLHWKYINYSIKQEYNHILIKKEPKEYEKMW